MERREVVFISADCVNAVFPFAVFFVYEYNLIRLKNLCSSPAQIKAYFVY